MSPRISQKSDRVAANRRLNDGIARELHRLPPETVRKFARTVGDALGTAEIHAKFAFEAKRIALLKRQQRATQRFVASFDADRPPIARQFPIRIDATAGQPSRDEQIAFYRAEHRAHDAARQYLRQLELSLSIAQNNIQRRRSRRPPADRFGLLACIARQYREILDIRPTSTPGGHFSNIAILVLENLTGKTASDVSRQVRAAIKSL